MLFYRVHLQGIRIANTTNPVSKSGARSRWFQATAGCAEIRAKPLLGLFLSVWCLGAHKVGAPWGGTVGGLGSEGDKTVLLGPKNWNPISSSKCTVLARHG